MEPVHPVSSVYLVNSVLPTCLTVLYLLGAACISCFVHFVPSFPQCTAVIIITKNENDDNNHHRLLRNGGEKSVICSHRHVMPGGCVNTWLTSLHYHSLLTTCAISNYLHPTMISPPVSSLATCMPLCLSLFVSVSLFLTLSQRCFFHCDKVPGRPLQLHLATVHDKTSCPLSALSGCCPATIYFVVFPVVLCCNYSIRAFYLFLTVIL